MGAVFLGRGDGRFDVGTTVVTSGWGIASLVDLNSDGVLDLLTSQSGPGLSIMFGNADFTGRRNNLIDHLDLLGPATARDALTVTASRLDALAREAGAIGTLQSRLQHSVAALTSRRDNYEIAASRIVDTDVAADAAALVRTGILQQAAVSVLAQANLQPQIALALLRG